MTLSIYCLDPDEDLVGCFTSVEQVTLGLFNFEKKVSGSFYVGSKQLLFWADVPQSVTFFNISDIRDVELKTGNVYFRCETAREGFTGGRPTPLHVVTPQHDRWHFRCRSDRFVPTLEAALLRHKTATILVHLENSLRTKHRDCCSFLVYRLFPMRQQRGLLYFTASSAMFEPLIPLPNGSTLQVSWERIAHVFPRHLIFDPTGLDFYGENGLIHLSLKFFSEPDRHNAIDILAKQYNISRWSPDFKAVLQSWQKGEMTNLDYLFFLNKLSGRSTLDLSQYPVLPWILSDYDSAELNISNPSVFRDLSKPVGCLDSQKLAELMKKSSFLGELEEEPYLYATHYSSAGAVAYFCLRSHPEYMLTLQNGKLDRPQRLFHSLKDSWESVLHHSADFKELIPEFFTNDFLSLHDRLPFELGRKDDGRLVSACVQLPRWAKSPRHFVELHRSTMESEHVSEHLHLWIDLIFGFKQDGSEGAKAHNSFHPYSYFDTAIKTKEERKIKVIENYAREFGVVPMKLFCDAHPRRYAPQEVDVSSILTAYSKSFYPTSPVELPSLVSPATSSTPPGYLVPGMDLATKSLRCTFQCPTEMPSFVQIQEVQDRTLVMIGHRNRKGFSLYDGTSGEKIRVFPDFDSPITCTCQVDEYALLFCNCSVYVFHLMEHVITEKLVHVMESTAVSCVYSRPSASLFVVDEEDIITTWGIEGGVANSLHNSPVGACQLPRTVVAFCIGKDGTFYAVLEGGEVVCGMDFSYKTLFSVSALTERVVGVEKTASGFFCVSSEGAYYLSDSGVVLSSVSFTAVFHFAPFAPHSVIIASVNKGQTSVLKCSENEVKMVGELDKPPFLFSCTERLLMAFISEQHICTVLEYI